MKKILYLLLTLLIITSCTKKEDVEYHKIKYEVIFSEIPRVGESNNIDLIAQPSYSNTNEDRTLAPWLSFTDAKVGYWSYEYWELKESDEIYFDIYAQLHYCFEMRIYIDDNEVSYKKVKISDYDYYDYFIIEEFGLGNTDGPTISFVY